MNDKEPYHGRDADLPLPSGPMRFGIGMWKKTPLPVKLEFLRLQQRARDLETELARLQDEVLVLMRGEAND